VCVCDSFTLIEKTKDEIRLGFSHHVVHLLLSPFRIDIIADSQPVISVNARGLLNFEHYRRRKSVTALLLTSVEPVSRCDQA